MVKKGITKMNKGFFGHLWLAGCVAALLTTNAWAVVDAAFTMQIVDVSGSPPANPKEITVEAGDVFTVRFFLDGWDTEELTGYIVSLAQGTLHNGGPAPLILAYQDCVTNADCFASTQVSNCMDGICTNGLTCNVALQNCTDSSACVAVDPDLCDCYASLYVDEARTNYVFKDRGAFVLNDCTSPTAQQDILRMGAAILAPGVTDTGAAKYVGTMIFEVPEGAGGDFTIALHQDPVYTALKDPDGFDIEPLDRSDYLTIHAGSIPCAMVSSDPPNCAIDARQPTSLDGVTNFTWNSIELTLTCPTSGLTAANFNVSETPAALDPPVIISATSDGGNVIDLVFNRRIRLNKWTCVAIAGDASEKVCVGALPADVDESVTSDVDDIGALIASLNAGDTEPDYSLDINRDGNVGPADILRVIDLLNGAGAFDPWLGEYIGDFTGPKQCPTAP